MHNKAYSYVLMENSCRRQVHVKQQSVEGVVNQRLSMDSLSRMCHKLAFTALVPFPSEYPSALLICCQRACSVHPSSLASLSFLLSCLCTRLVSLLFHLPACLFTTLFVVLSTLPSAYLSVRLSLHSSVRLFVTAFFYPTNFLLLRLCLSSSLYSSVLPVPSASGCTEGT